MHWPEPIKAHFAGPGKVLGFLVTALALGFTVYVLEWIGLAITVSVILVGLVVELWLEDGRRGKKLAELEQKVLTSEGKADTTLDELEAQKRELTTAREDVDKHSLELAGLRAELAESQAEADRLRRELANPAYGIEAVLEGLAAQLRLADLVQKHRALEQEGLEEWPVLRARLLDDGAVLVEAYVGDHAERLVDEWVMIDADFDTVEMVRVGNADNREIFIRTSIDRLPDELAEELERSGTVSGPGLTVGLAGLKVEPFCYMDAGAVDDLRDSLAGVAESLNRALRGTAQMELPQESEVTDDGTSNPDPGPPAPRS